MVDHQRRIRVLIHTLPRQKTLVLNCSTWNSRSQSTEQGEKNLLFPQWVFHVEQSLTRGLSSETTSHCRVSGLSKVPRGTLAFHPSRFRVELQFFLTNRATPFSTASMNKPSDSTSEIRHRSPFDSGGSLTNMQPPRRSRWEAWAAV